MNAHTLRYVRLERDGESFLAYETHAIQAELGSLGWHAACTRHTQHPHTALHPILSTAVLTAAANCAAWMQSSEK